MDFQIVKSLINTNRCIVIDTQQRSQNWFNLRKSRITMSMLGTILIFSKTEEEKWRTARIICGLEKPIFSKESEENMKIGVDYEDDVRKEYSKIINMKIYEVGFCIFENPIFGGSLDGLIENGDILEIKISKNEIPEKQCDDYSEIPIYYLWQMWGNMFITDASNCHYVMYSRASKKLYCRLVPYIHVRWINECYIPLCSFYENYVIPIIKANSLPNLYDEYQLMRKNF